MRSKWTARDVGTIVSWLLAIVGLLAVLVAEAPGPVKVAAAVAVIAAFWVGRLMGREDSGEA